MNTQLIAQTWRSLGERQPQFIKAFYARFFERYPGYRKLFPGDLRQAHLQKMIDTVALLGDLADDRNDIAPHLHKLGAAHRPFDLHARDYRNFQTVFVEVLRQELGARWPAAAGLAWNDAFEQVLIPLLREGAEGRMRRRA